MIVPEVALGTWTPDELLTAGFDEVGVPRPLLREAGYTDDPEWSTRRRHVAAQLQARGLLVPGHSGGLQTAGDLRVVLTTRALARLCIEMMVTSGDGSVQRSVLLGLFAGGDGVLMLHDSLTSVSAELFTRGSATDRILYGFAGELPDGAAPPAVHEGRDGWESVQRNLFTARGAVRLEGVRFSVDDRPPDRCRVALVDTDDGPWLLAGHRDDRSGGGWARRATRDAAADLVRSALVGDCAR